MPLPSFWSLFSGSSVDTVSENNFEKCFEHNRELMEYILEYEQERQHLLSERNRTNAYVLTLESHISGLNQESGSKRARISTPEAIEPVPPTKKCRPTPAEVPAVSPKAVAVSPKAPPALVSCMMPVMPKKFCNEKDYFKGIRVGSIVQCGRTTERVTGLHIVRGRKRGDKEYNFTISITNRSKNVGVDRVTLVSNTEDASVLSISNHFRNRIHNGSAYIVDRCSMVGVEKSKDIRMRTRLSNGHVIDEMFSQ